MTALELTFERNFEEDVTLVRATGRLSVHSAATMRTALAKCVAECPSAVVVDVRGCVAETASALAVFPAAARGQHARPPVAIILCGADDEFLRDGRRSALGSVALYESCAQALAAVAVTRIRQLRVLLQDRPSLRFPARAREAIGHACDDWGLPHLRAGATLIMSELVTNAVRYSAGDITVEAMVRGDFFHIRVRDGSTAPPDAMPGRPVLMPSATELVERGRGLQIVASYSSDWGYVINPDGTGKVVWATLRHRQLGTSG
jgi:anti-sigma regulatory factor (Ser/Thr protein kinase)